MYKPDVAQMTTPIRIMHRTETIVNGAPDIAYSAAGYMSFCNIKALHGSESLRAGVLGINEGGTITMWYDPAVSIKDRIRVEDSTDNEYEVISAEDVELRHQYLILKVQRVVNP